MVRQVVSSLQAAAQFLLDDWAPESPEWYDESTGTWHYDPYEQDEDHITGLKDMQGSDMVLQCLSDFQGVPVHQGCPPFADAADANACFQQAQLSIA